MNNINLTDPENYTHHRKPRVKTNWDHKEQTIKCLLNLGVPIQCADVASVDLNDMFNVTYRNKLTPEQAAKILYEEVKARYTRSDGNWHFTKSK